MILKGKSRTDNLKSWTFTTWKNLAFGIEITKTVKVNNKKIG